MGREFELKYAATEDAQEKIAAAYGSFQTFSMQTTYYDTAEGSLAARKWMLRQRLENGTKVCTLKTPAGEARNEWEVCGLRIEDGITELCKLGAPEDLLVLTKAGVRPICGAELPAWRPTLRWTAQRWRWRWTQAFCLPVTAGHRCASWRWS